MNTSADISDEILVAQSLNGHRAAFEEIVRRYQVLLCSVAYSSNGNVAQSEDVAQDAFVAAWTRLGELREPGKLRAWLCGITRNLAHNSRRRETRRATESLDTLAASSEPASEDERPDEASSRADDEALTWRALERVPEIYREALVLYYRQHQSIEHVAASLEVSEETVRQRLSRGRKALHDQVMALLGATLTRTVPAMAFTTSVMSALPIAQVPAAAAGAAVGTAASGAALVKSGGAAKSASLAWLGAPALAAVLGAVGLALGNRVAEELTESTRERAYIRARGRVLVVITGALLVGLSAIFFGWPAIGTPTVPTLAIASMSFAASWSLVLFAYAFRTTQRQIEIRVEDARLSGVSVARRHYVSSRKFLGLPLLAINLLSNEPVRAWIAIGQFAQAGLLAVGQFAVGPIAVGACGLGLFSFAAIGTGLVSFSAFSIGWWASGGFAYGYDALAGVAIGSHFAGGGIAWANEYAEGARALAAHANDAAAFHVLQTHPLFHFYSIMPWAGAILAGLALIPNLLMLKKLHQR